MNLEIRKRQGEVCDSVAIKEESKSADLTKQELDERFNQEVAVLSALSHHPNIIKLLCYTNNPNCLVTPLYQGSLDDLIHSKNKKYTSLDLADIVCQLISALDAIHNREIAHRDIKPLNILLEKRQVNVASKRSPSEWSSFGFRIKIGDFGVCFVNEKEANSQLKIANAFGLSIPYAAPEVFALLAANSSRVKLEDFQFADVYSFGITLWELMHREEPWKGFDKQAIQIAVMSGNRPQITFQAKEDNKVLFMLTAIESCWNQDANGRPFFKDLVKQLRGLMDLESYPYSQTNI